MFILYRCALLSPVPHGNRGASLLSFEVFRVMLLCVWYFIVFGSTLCLHNSR